jgi:hypothetical protein
LILNLRRAYKGRFALADGVPARAIEVRRLLHRLAFGAAILARRCHARTNGVRTLLRLRSPHFLFPRISRHFFSPKRVTQRIILDTEKKSFCTIMNTLQCLSTSGYRRCGWQYVGFRDRSRRFSSHNHDEFSDSRVLNPGLRASWLNPACCPAQGAPTLAEVFSSSQPEVRNADSKQIFNYVLKAAAWILSSRSNTEQLTRVSGQSKRFAN